jgi:hypothetical protein
MALESAVALSLRFAISVRMPASGSRSTSIAGISSIGAGPAESASSLSIWRERSAMRADASTRASSISGSDIGLMTPSVVHHGHAEQVHAARARVLAAAYAATPETLRPTRAPTTRAARRRLNQQTRARGARRSLNSQTTCLIRLDRFRPSI